MGGLAGSAGENVCDAASSFRGDECHDQGVIPVIGAEAENGGTCANYLHFGLV